jgi:hypothetical protein
MRKVVYLPHYGEFGFLIMNHLRAVHQDEAGIKIVCCERGTECLFPSATGFFHDYPALRDEHRGGDTSDWKWKDCEESDSRLQQILPQSYPGHEIVRLKYESPWSVSHSIKFCPKVAAELPSVDVVLGVRKRAFCPEKNWQHWEQLADALQSVGLTVGLVGTQETSCDIRADARSWDHSQGATAGTVDLLNHCRLYVGTDTGTSHLAALMDVPQLTFRFVGQVQGNDDFLPMMERTNRRYFRRLEDAVWQRPDEVLGAVIRNLRELRICKVFRPDPWNIGDWAARPSLYFPISGADYDVRLDDMAAIPSEVAIVGGGGLLSTYESELSNLKHRVIIWGAGANHHGETQLRYPPWLEDCALVGVRDYGTRFRWVPCASCMSALFDKYRSRPPEREVVVYRHSLQWLDTIPTDLQLPTLTNQEMSFENVLAFLASAEVVITSSYHGAYWATLLGRKVIAAPFSSKFYGFRHPPVLATGERLADWRSLAKDCEIYLNSLEECRTVNLAFYEDVKRTIG